MAEKQYVGKGWQSKYGIRMSLKKSDIEKMPTDKYGNVLIQVCERREPDERSKATHYVIVDQFAYDRLNEGGTNETAF